MVKTNKKLIERRKGAKTDKSEIIVNMDRFWELIFETILMVSGIFLLTISINLFLLPHKLTTGGVTGIGTILYYIFKVPVGITVIVLNMPLFILAIKNLGIKFSLKTIVATVMLSFFLETFKFESFLQAQHIDLFTACIFGGLVSGIGLSLVFKIGASTGGSDLLAQIVYKTTPVQSVSEALLVIEAVIIMGIIVAFKDINLGLYSIISLFVSTKVIDIMFQGVYHTKVITIITRHPDNIIELILNDLRRGATVTKSVGAHSGDEVTNITCIITRSQISKLKKIVSQQDPRALMYITTSSEVLGEGFKEIE